MEKFKITNLKGKTLKPKERYVGDSYYAELFEDETRKEIKAYEKLTGYKYHEEKCKELEYAELAVELLKGLPLTTGIRLITGPKYYTVCWYQKEVNE